MRPETVLSDRALCLPTFSHFLIVNKTSLALRERASEREGHAFAGLLFSDSERRERERARARARERERERERGLVVTVPLRFVCKAIRLYNNVARKEC